jgi:hypothetical protein
LTPLLGTPCLPLIGPTAILTAVTAAQMSSLLPSDWSAGLAALGVLIAWMYVVQRSRRRAAREAQVVAARMRLLDAQLDSVELQGLVFRRGWWIPSSRATTFRPRRVTYAWPVHREYPVRWLG